MSCDVSPVAMFFSFFWINTHFFKKLYWFYQKLTKVPPPLWLVYMIFPRVFITKSGQKLWGGKAASEKAKECWHSTFTNYSYITGMRSDNSVKEKKTSKGKIMLAPHLYQPFIHSANASVKQKRISSGKLRLASLPCQPFKHGLQFFTKNYDIIQNGNFKRNNINYQKSRRAEVSFKAKWGFQFESLPFREKT